MAIILDARLTMVEIALDEAKKATGAFSQAHPADRDITVALQQLTQANEKMLQVLRDWEVRIPQK